MQDPMATHMEYKRWENIYAEKKIGIEKGLSEEGTTLYSGWQMSAWCTDVSCNMK